MNLNATALGQVTTFILFVLSCTRYVWPLLTTAIEKRQEETADSLTSVERVHKDLGLAEANATDRLKKAEAEVQVIIEQTNKHRVQVLDKTKTEAEQERTKIVTQAQAETDAERKRVHEEPYKQTAILAAAGAEKIIERFVDEAANNDIVGKLVAEL